MSLVATRLDDEKVGIPLNADTEMNNDLINLPIGESSIANADNFDWVSDASIDFILTDPPFNIARDTNFHTWEKNTINSYRFDGDKGWDSYSGDEFRNLMDLWAASFSRVLKRGGSFAVFCADIYISDLMSSLGKAGLSPKRTITWRKPNAVPVNRKHMMMSACEYIVTGVKKSKSTFNSTLTINQDSHYSIGEAVNISDKVASIIEIALRNNIMSRGTRVTNEQLTELAENVINNVLPEALARAQKIYKSPSTVELCVPNFVNFNSKSGNRLHPTEKPVDLLMYLIELFSNENDTVLDPFSGSGSTGEAALKLNRKFRLVEKDEEFFFASVKRLEKVYGELRNQLSY